MTNAELIAMLRKAEELLADNECQCLNPTCLGARNRAARNRINEALAAADLPKNDYGKPRDCCGSVHHPLDPCPAREPIEPDPFYKLEQYRAKVGDYRIAVSRTGPKEWCWHTSSVLVPRSASGEKPTFAEAAQAALDAMRWLK